MYSFKDSTGRDWCIVLNVGTIQRVYKETGFNLRKLADGDEENPLGPCFEFVSDPIAFCPVLYAILSPELKKTGVTEEQFYESLDAEPAYEAGQAFTRAYVDFFLVAKREVFHKQIDKSTEIWKAGSKAAAEKMDQIDVTALAKKMSDEIDAHLARLWKASSGNVPASSDSTQDLSLSANL